MAKNDFEFKSFFDFNEWLASEAGKNALQLDNFNEALQNKHKNEIEIGKKMHNIGKDFREIQQVYAEAGFSKLDIKTSSSGTVFTFLTPGGEIDPESCPSIEISNEDGGLLIHNGMVAYNSPVAVMNGADQLGFVSETSLMLHRVKEEIEAKMGSINQQNSLHEKAKLIQFYTRKVYHSSTQEIAGLFDLKSLGKDLKEYSTKAALKKRPEAVQAQSNQLHYMTAFKQMFDKAQKANKIRASVEFEKFTAELEEVMDLARMTRDITELEKGLKFNRARYNNALKIWDSGLKNFFTPIIKELTQGGMTEGTRGRAGLQELDLPFSRFSNTGKKANQNTQVFEQKNVFASNEKRKLEDRIKTTAIGKNQIFTESQKKLLRSYGLDDESLHKDLYGVAYISEEHIHKAQELIKERKDELIKKIGKKGYRKLMLDSAKGFGYDAAFMTESFAKEMSDIKEERSLKDMDVEQINSMIGQRIASYIKRHKPKGANAKEKAKIQKDVDAELEKLKNFNFFELTEKDFEGEGYHRQLRKYFRETMRTLYPSLDDKSGTHGGGVLNTGFWYDYDKENKRITNVKTIRESSPYARIGRGGATGDARHNQGVISDLYRDFLVEAAFGKDYKYKDQISLFRSNDTGYSNKTAQRDIVEFYNTMIAFGNKQKIEALMKDKDSVFGRYLKYDEDGDFSVKEEQLEKDFFTAKKDASGNKTFEKSAADFLVELYKTAADLGIEGYEKDNFQLMKEADLKKIIGENYDGGDLLVSKNPHIKLTEDAFSSTYGWEGFGDQSNTFPRYTWRELATYKHSYNRMSNWLLDNGVKADSQEYRDAMTPMRNVLERLEEEKFKKEQEYQGILNNAKNIEQTFRTDTVQYEKDVRADKTNIILEAEEIANIIASGKGIVEWENEKLVFKGDDPSKFFLNIIEEKVKNKFNELKAAHEGDWESFSNKYGIKTKEDLYGKIFAATGKEGLEGIIGGQHLKTRMVALPNIKFEKDKDGSFTTLGGTKEALDIIGSLQNIAQAPSAQKAAARRNALYSIVDSYANYRESIVSGSEYQRTHSFDLGKSGGYLKTLALTDNASEIIKEVGLHSKITEALTDAQKEETRQELSEVNAVMSTTDFKAMWHKKLEEGPEENRIKTRQLVDEMYDAFVSEERRKKIKKNDYRAKLNKIAEALDISGDYFTGHTLKTMNWFRHPTINFSDDINGLTAVLSSDKTLFPEGNVYMDKHLLALDNGDSDGDLIAMENAIRAGDMEKFGRAYQSYQAHIRKQQKIIDEDDEKKNKQIAEALSKHFSKNGKNIAPEQLQFGEASKVNFVQDIVAKNMTTGAMFDAKKGAGVYGDLVYAFENMLSPYKDISVNDEQNSKQAIEARALHAFAQSLYQRGINIKNASKLAQSVGAEVKENYSEGEKSAMALAQINSMFEMLNEKATFDDEATFRTFLEKGELIGAFDLDAMFEGNALRTFGTGDFGEVAFKNLLEVAERHKAHLEKSTYRNKEVYISKINKDIEAIKQAQEGNVEAFKNVTNELLVALGMDFNNNYARGENTTGNVIPKRYFLGMIPGHNSLKNGVPFFNKAVETLTNKAKDKMTEEEKEEFEKLESISPWEINKNINGALGISPVSAKSTTSSIAELIVGKGNNPDESKIVSDIINTKFNTQQEFDNKFADYFMENGGKRRGSIMAIIRGNIAHETAEAIQKYGANYGKHKEYKNSLDQYRKVLNFLNPTDQLAVNELIDEAVGMGKDNLAYVQQLIKENGGHIVATEAALAGYGGITNGKNKNVKVKNQKADILYKKDNELTVGDWKIYGGDTPGIAPMLQVFDYMTSLKSLQAEMDNLKKTDALTFLNDDTSNVAKAWKTRIERRAKNDLGGGEGAYEQAFEEFKEIYDSINRGEDPTKISGRIFLRNSNTGMLREYGIKSDSKSLGYLYAKYLESGKSFEEFEQSLMESSDPHVLKAQQELQLLNTVFSGDEKQKERLFSAPTKNFHEKQLNLVKAQKTLEQNEKTLENLENLDRIGVLSDKDRQIYLELKKQTEDLKLTIGSDKDFEEFKKTEEELNKAYKDLAEAKSKNDEALKAQNLERIAALKAQKEALSNTLNYQAAKAGEELKEQKTSDDQNFGKDAYDFTKTVATTEGEAEAEASQPENANVRFAIDKYKQVAEEAYRAAAAAKSRLLNEDERKTAEEEARIKEITRAMMEAYLEKVLKDSYFKDGKMVYTDVSGKEIDEKDAVRRGYTLNIKDYNKTAQDEAMKNIEVSDHTAIVSYETKAYNFLTDQWKRQEEIEELQKKIKEAQTKGDETELEHLQKKKAFSEKIYAGYTAIEKADLEKFKGSNPESYKKIVELTNLEHLLRVAEKEKTENRRAPQGQGGGSGSGGFGFLGIDSATTRWLSRMMNGGLVYAFIRRVRQGFKDLTNKAKQLDQAMTNLRIVTGKNSEDARTLIGSYARLGKELGATTIEVTNAAQAWLRQGYDIAQVNDLVTASMYLSKLGMIDTATATQNLTSAMHGFKLEASEAMEVVDKLTALDVKAATTAGDIAQGLSQFANIASLGGVSIDQAAAYVATIADVNQMSGITVGQSLKTIMSRYGNVKAGAYNKLNLDSESTDTSEKLNDVERVLNKMGVSIRQTNLEFKDFDEVLDEIAGKWNNLDNVSKRAIANAFAGVRQQEAFMILLENYDKYKDLLEVSETSQGTAEKKYRSYKESYASAKNEFTAALEQFANSSELSKLLTELIKTGTGIVETLQKFYPFLPGIVSNIMMYKTIQGKGLLNQGYNLLNRGFGGVNSVSGNNFSGTPVGRTTRSLWAGVRQKFTTGSFRDVEDITDKDSEEYHKVRRHYNYIAGKKGLKKADEYWYKTQETARKQKERNEKIKQDQEKIKQDQEKKLQNEQRKFMREGYEYALKEVALKKQILTPAQQEVLLAETELSESTQKSLVEKGILKEDQKRINVAQAIAILDSGILKNTSIAKQLEAEIYKARKQGKVVEEDVKNIREKYKENGGIPVNPKILKADKFRSYLSYAEMGANILTTSLTQLTSAATTHTYNNETVESSKEAQKKGGAVSAVLSTLPVLGSFLGPLVGEMVAAETDKYRDRANYITKSANEKLANLNSLSTSIQQLEDSEQNSAERHKLVQEFKKKIFDEENTELRAQLKKHLGSGETINSILNRIDGNTANSNESLEALKTLQTAQLEAEKAQISSKYSSSLYELTQQMGDTISKLEEYNGFGFNNYADAALMTGTAAAGGAATGALAGSFFPGIGNLSGAAIGAIVGAVSGLIAGGISAAVKQEAAAATNRANNGDLSDIYHWYAKNSIERSDEVEKDLEDAQKKLEKAEKRYEDRKKDLDDIVEEYTKGTVSVPDVQDAIDIVEIARKDFEKQQKQVEALQELKMLLDEQTSIQIQILDEVNDITLKQGLVNAKSGDRYLTEMSIKELKNLGVQGILTAYANSIEKSGGLEGISVWSDASKKSLDEAGYDYLFEALKDLEDEEINSVLSGGVYTLSEALDLKNNRESDSYEDTKRLGSFANALGVDISELDDLKDKFGLLTLSDLLLSTSEMTEKVSGYTDLMNSISNGAGDVSSWMEKIISQFPALTRYMGDTSELFAQSIEYIDQFSNAYRKAQADEFLTSSGFFESIEKEIYASIGDASLQKSLAEYSPTNLSGVFKWFQTQTNPDGTLSGSVQGAYENILKLMDDLNIKITSKIDKAYYDMLIDYKTKTIDYMLQNLNSQKEALRDINNEREYENKLIEARLKLEDASKQKKRVYRAGVGWVYEADQAAIEEAQKELDTLNREKQISMLEEQITILEKQKEEINSVYEKENYETLKKIFDASVEKGKISPETNQFISDIKDSVGGISTSLSKILENLLKEDSEAKKKAVGEAQVAWQNLRSASVGTEAYNKALETFHAKMKIAKDMGVKDSEFTGKGWEDYDQTGGRIEKGTTALGVAGTDISKQKMYVKKNFSLQAIGDEKNRYVGFTNGDFIDNTTADYILEGLKNGRALIWYKNENGEIVSTTAGGSGGLFKGKSSDETLADYFERVGKYSSEIVVSDPEGSNESVYYNGQMYKITNDYGEGDENGLHRKSTSDLSSSLQGTLFAKANNGGDSFSSEVWDAVKEKLGQSYNYIPTSELNRIARQVAEERARGYAEGTLSLINEEGTEAIVTPQGTLTALPSRTGIVPADITKNLWELGEVAPELLRILGNKLPNGLSGTSIFDRIVSDESFNISNLTMNVDADSSFDVDKFVNSIKSRVALTKNNSK